MKVVVAAMFSLGLVVSAEAADQLDILAELDKMPSPLITYPNLTPSNCETQYSDAVVVVREFKKLDSSLQTASNLKKMLEFQTSYSAFVAKQDPKKSPSCSAN